MGGFIVRWFGCRLLACTVGCGFTGSVFSVFGLPSLLGRGSRGVRPLWLWLRRRLWLIKVDRPVSVCMQPSISLEEWATYALFFLAVRTNAAFWDGQNRL